MLEWPYLEARRDRSSLLLFHKIHSGAVSMEKDKYLTPTHSLKSTRASHSAQYCRYQTYSDALKNSFSPELFHSGMVFLLRWSIPRLLRSLGHSSFSQTQPKCFSFFVFFFVLFCFCFLFCFVLFFSSKFQISTPWRNDRMLSCQKLKKEMKEKYCSSYTIYRKSNYNIRYSSVTNEISTNVSLIVLNITLQIKLLLFSDSTRRQLSLTTTKRQDAVRCGINLTYTYRNNNFNFRMKVALSTQDSSKFKFDMSINMSLRSYCISSLILSIPVAEYYHTY